MLLKLDPGGAMRPQAGNVGPGPAGDRGSRIEGTRQARPRGRPPPALAGCRAHRCQGKTFRPSGIPAADAPRHESLVTCTAEGLQGEAGRRRDSDAPGRAAPSGSSRGRCAPTHPPCLCAPGTPVATRGRRRPPRASQRRGRRTKGAPGTSASRTWTHLLPEPAGPAPRRPPAPAKELIFAQRRS